jgi:hypothetical protein
LETKNTYNKITRHDDANSLNHYRVRGKPWPHSPIHRSFLAFSRACKTHTPLTNQRKRQANNSRAGFHGRTLRLVSLGSPRSRQVGRVRSSSHQPYPISSQRIHTAMHTLQGAAAPCASGAICIQRHLVSCSCRLGTTIYRETTYAFTTSMPSLLLLTGN